MTVPVPASISNQKPTALTPYPASAWLKPSIARIKMKQTRHTLGQIVRNKDFGDEYIGISKRAI